MAPAQRRRMAAAELAAAKCIEAMAKEGTSGARRLEAGLRSSQLGQSMLRSSQAGRPTKIAADVRTVIRGVAAEVPARVLTRFQSIPSWPVLSQNWPPLPTRSIIIASGTLTTLLITWASATHPILFLDPQSEQPSAKDSQTFLEVVANTRLCHLPLRPPRSFRVRGWLPGTPAVSRI